MSAQLAEVPPPEPRDSVSMGLVMHVEDDEDLRRSTCMVLRLAGFETCEATCGAHALAQAESLRGKVDVLIVDYHLGDGITGTEVAERFSRLSGHAVPTVILTGDPTNVEIPWLLDAPIWLARKPLHSETLLAALPPLVEFRRAVGSSTQVLVARPNPVARPHLVASTLLT
jgi:CheY-like chemotaxis protein